MRKFLARLPLMAACLILLSTANSVLAQVDKVYNAAVPSTVLIVNSKGSGTGVVVDVQRRLVVTNRHVVGSDRKVKVFFPAKDNEGRLISNRQTYFNRENWPKLARSQRAMDGVVIATRPQQDLALVQLPALPAGTRAIPFAAAAPKVGQLLHVIGHPDGRPLWTYTLNQASWAGHEQWTQDGSRLSAHIVVLRGHTWAGNSGGPVLNDKGQLVAVITGGTRNGFVTSIAIDVREIRAMLGDLSTDSATLAGTEWSGKETLAGFGELTFRFHAKGKVTMIDAQSTVTGTWSRNGNQVTIRFGNCVYQGRINGQVMAGTAGGEPGNWTFRVTLATANR